MTSGGSDAVARIETGISGLDEIASGGLPAPRSTLVAGTAGTGKTLLAVQFLVMGTERHDDSGVLVAFDEPPDEMVRNVQSLGWDLGRLVDAGRLVIVDLTPSSEESTEVGEFDLAGLLARLENAVAKVGAKRVVLDALTAFFPRFADYSLVRRELQRLTSRLRELGVTTLITAERAEEYGPVARYGVEEFVADNVIILRNPLEFERRRRTIEILKLRGGGHERGEFPFGIDAQRGVIVHPLAALEPAREAPVRRLSLGNATLDEMCGGGIFSDSIALVLGPSGAGKTLTALHFLDAGCRQGERTVFYTFDESSAQVARNAAAWGFDLEGPERDGTLKIVARYPDRLGLEDLLIDIGRELGERQPVRIVLDSLSVLERVSSGKSFREFVVGLRSLVKAHAVATLCTYDHGVGPDRARPQFSTMVDAIVELGFVEVSGVVRRWLTVVKLRGSRHDLAIREYRIGDDGMTLLEPVEELTGLFT